MADIEQLLGRTDASDFAKAVAGWKQSIGILKGVSDGLRFAIDEINANKTAFSPDREKAGLRRPPGRSGRRKCICVLMSRMGTTMAETFPRYMMATKADHQLGDISRDEPDICRVESEDGDNYIGAWVTGFGFFNVKFPKDTTRDLTPEEIDHYDGRHYRINSQPSFPIKVRT